MHKLTTIALLAMTATGCITNIRNDGGEADLKPAILRDVAYEKYDISSSSVSATDQRIGILPLYRNNMFTVGGMATKLKAAAMAACCGDPLWIADGHDFGILKRIFRGDDIGSLFLPSRQYRLHARQRYLAYFAEPEGELFIDDGAEDALVKQGRSLLPGGVLGMRGSFDAGATVRISNVRREELGRGVVNYGNVELSRICGAATEQLAELLGHEPQAKEVVHRNAMVLFVQ